MIKKEEEVMQGKLDVIVNKKERKRRGKLSREVNNVSQKLLATPTHHRKRRANLMKRLAELQSQQKKY